MPEALFIDFFLSEGRFFLLKGIFFAFLVF